MNLTQTTALKWTFYALAAAALFFLRRLLLGSMTFFGIIPFLPPVILAVMASFELPRSAVIAGIVFGALCDLVLPAPFACLYTIAFTLAALLISTVVSNLLQQGFARALLSTVLTFLLVDLLQAFALLPRGEIDLDLGTDIRMNAVEEKPRYFTEEDEISQGVLAVGFRLGECMDDPDPAKLAVFNAVYGAGVTSKLFQNVREKLSLCYYAFSSTDTLKGIMAVLSGIEVDKYDEALSEILAQLDAVRAGDISETELAAARRSVANDLRTGADSPYYLADFYLRETVQGTDATPDDIAVLAETVTAEDVAAIARGVELDAVYFLRGEEAETE